MSSTQDLTQWIGRRVTTRDGADVGRVVDLFIDEDTNEPEWLAIDIDASGDLTYVPIAAVSDDGGDVSVPFEVEHVTSAPGASRDGVLTRDDEAALYSHYGIQAPMASDAAPEVTRSEEELHVTTRPVEAGRVRLRKFVETEEVSATVPVRRDEVRVAREPITADDAESLAEEPFSESEVEVVLQEDEIVATTVTVPKERVRLETETVTEEREVSAELRSERVELDPGADESDA